MNRCAPAPVSGHNYHGLCERKILTVQEILQRMEVDKMRLHATGYQTLMKLIENEVNNLPVGFTYGRHNDNSRWSNQGPQEPRRVDEEDSECI